MTIVCEACGVSIALDLRPGSIVVHDVCSKCDNRWRVARRLPCPFKRVATYKGSHDEASHY